LIEKSFGNSRIYIGFHTQYQYFIYDGTYQDNIGYGKLCIYLVSADDTVIVDKSAFKKNIIKVKENNPDIANTVEKYTCFKRKLEKITSLKTCFLCGKEIYKLRTCISCNWIKCSWCSSCGCDRPALH
tara:strand:+ start:604 stop:987 length:384 start_codon:yes stop_codon:yes gene_type:complete